MKRVWKIVVATVVCLASLPLVAHFESRLLAADLDYPLAIASASEGPIFLADRNLPGIWKIDGEKLSVLFQASKKFRTPLNAVRCVALDSQGKLLAGDSATRDVYRMSDAGEPQPLTKGGIGIPMSIAVLKGGDLVVADLELHVIWKVAAQGGAPEKIAEIPAPRGLAVDAEDRIWIVSHGPDQVVRLKLDGAREPIVKGRPFQFPHQIVLGADGEAFVTDGYAKAVWRIKEGEEPKKWAEGEPLINPVGIARRGPMVLVADPRAKAVLQINEQGQMTRLPLNP
jgi:streptogramin lyase